MVTHTEAARAAFIVWQDRIAPVFDTAAQAMVVERGPDGRTSARLEALTGPTAAHRLMRLKDRGVGTVVCGAMSRPVQQVAASCGLRVVAFVAGETGDMVEAWLEGRLEDPRYAMPGCAARRQRRRRRKRD